MFSRNLPDNQKKMATVKIGWIFFQLFGWPITFLSLSDKFSVWLNFPAASFHLKEPYQSVISWLAIIFLITMILRNFEFWREKHMANNHRAHQMKRKYRNELLEDEND